ncbi:unnamed protein product [marine sediment metagenome]|uniref:Type II secretion system protein GspE N-terminal domain-containing protein n=1 Tax=marine sediment metagenome TaxID=412755 RepID=X1CPP3_9ZZZZ
MKTVQDTPNSSKTKADILFGEFLISKELLSPRELIEVLNKQHGQGGRLGELLVQLKILSEDDVTMALAEYLSMEYIRLDETDKINMNIARILPESIAKRFCLVAIGEENEKIVVAMADPLNVIAIDTITLKIKHQIKPVISSAKEIRRAIEIIYHGSDVEEQYLRDLVETEIDNEDKQEIVSVEETDEMDISNEAEATKPPVIRFVDLLLSQAVKSRASDIHVEPQKNR